MKKIQQVTIVKEKIYTIQLYKLNHETGEFDHHHFTLDPHRTLTGAQDMLVSYLKQHYGEEIKRNKWPQNTFHEEYIGEQEHIEDENIIYQYGGPCFQNVSVQNEIEFQNMQLKDIRDFLPNIQWNIIPQYLITS
jgi:hypothetical protein